MIRILSYYMISLNQQKKSITFTACQCNSTTVEGYGKCQKRSSRAGGKFVCVVDQNSTCSDKVLYRKTGHYISVKACNEMNKGNIIKGLNWIFSFYYNAYA